MNHHCRNHYQQTLFGVSKLQAFTVPLFNKMISVDLLPSFSDYAYGAVFIVESERCNPEYLVFIPGIASTVRGVSVHDIHFTGRETDGGKLATERGLSCTAPVRRKRCNSCLVNFAGEEDTQKQIRACFHLLLACFL